MARRQPFRFGDAGAKALPRNDRRDRLEWVLPGLARRNQGGADAGIEADLLIDGASVGLKGAGMPDLGLGEHRSDKPFEQIDRLIGQSDAELEGDRDQGGVAALPLIAGDMLGRRPPGFTGKLREAGLMHAMPARGVDADRPDIHWSAAGVPDGADSTASARSRGGCDRLGSARAIARSVSVSV